MSTEVEYPHEQSTVSLVNGILVDLQQLVEQQLQLARREIEDEIHRRLAAAAMFVLGVGVLFLDAIVLCLALAHLLHWSTSPPGTDPSWFPLWACHAVVATVLVVIGGLMLQIARIRFRSIAAYQNSTNATL